MPSKIAILFYMGLMISLAGCAEAMRADFGQSIACDADSPDAGQVEALYEAVGADLAEKRTDSAAQQRALALLDEATRVRAACSGLPNAEPPTVNFAEVLKRVRRLTIVTHRAAQIAKAERTHTIDRVTTVDENGEKNYHFQVNYSITDEEIDASFQRAGELYSAYLETLETVALSPKITEEYAMTFFFGELLWTRQQWERALVVYERAIELEPRGKYSKATNVAVALLYLKVLDLPQKPARLDLMKYMSRPVPEPEIIPELYRRAINAFERFWRINPSKDRHTRMRMGRARIYYRYNHLEKALKIFREIASNRMECHLPPAVNFYLDTLCRVHDVEELRDAVKRYSATAPICAERFKHTINIHGGPPTNENFRMNLQRLRKQLR